jgi:hypothetical protein
MDQNEQTYTVGLALFDVVPVVLSVLGCWLLARLSARTLPSVARTAYLGVVLIAVGGGAKALWKIVLTTLDTDVTWMEQMLFPFLSVGFMLLLWSLWSAIVGRRIVRWPFVAVVLLGFAGTIATQRSTPLLAVAAGAALMTSGVAIRWAVLVRSAIPVVLYAVGMGFSIVLAYLAGPKIEQTLAMQWVEEGVNTVGQGCFLLASWLLARRVATHDSTASRAADHSPSAVDV